MGGSSFGVIGDGNEQRIEGSFNQTVINYNAPIIQQVAPATSTASTPAPPIVPHHPPPQNLPWGTLGHLFKGREEFLTKLRDTLTTKPTGPGLPQAAAIVQDGGPAKPAAIHALGGIGKTRAAVEYAWKYEHEYTALLYVYAASPGDLLDGLAKLAAPALLNLPEHEAKETDVKVAAVLKHLHEQPGWLLILDNVDTVEASAAVKKLLPQLSSGHVLITSRLDQWPGGVEPLELEVLSDEAGAEFLLEFTHGKRESATDDAAVAIEVAARLGGLALALEQAGAHIGHLGLSFRRYLERLDANAGKVLGWYNDGLMQYPKPVAETWLATFDQLTESQRRLLHILAWFDAQPLPSWLLENPPDGLDKDSVEEDLAALAAWHLVKPVPEGGGRRMHRLVLEVTLMQMSDEGERGRSLALALAWLEKVQPGNSQDVRTWTRWEWLYGHALCLARHAEAAGIWESAVNWQNEVASLLDNKARHSEAEPLYRHALALAKNHLPGHELTSVLLNNLAVLLQQTNRPEEAEPLLEHVVSIWEKAHGPDHPTVGFALNNLAQLLKATNRITEAESLMRRTLAISEASYGPDHPNVAIRLNNLAALLMATSREEAAEPLFRRALAIDEAMFGLDQPEVARDLSNLAQLLQATNRGDEAGPLMERVVSIWENAYGPDHPHVAIALNNLANLLQATDRFVEAEPLSRRHLVIFLKFQASAGHEHPHLRTAVCNYWAILHALHLKPDVMRTRIDSVVDEVAMEREAWKALLKEVLE